MAEVIGPGGQRIKFQATWTGAFQLPDPPPQALVQLSELMQRLEASGMVPILDDGLVGGNCACTATLCGLDGGGTTKCGSTDGGSESSNLAGSSHGATSCSGNGGAGAGSTAASGLPPVPTGGIVVSRSGKDPHAPLQAGDWVLLTQFDPSSWSAEYRSASPAARPTSDAPLHAAALLPSAAQRFGWAAAPAVAVHGHALASGAGLEAARLAGLPISEAETLFSTPDDLAALEQLFRCASACILLSAVSTSACVVCYRLPASPPVAAPTHPTRAPYPCRCRSHPYPHHRCYIRRGHGFTLLHDSVEGAARYLEEQLLPLLASCAD